jgi:hypothetical protein
VSTVAKIKPDPEPATLSAAMASAFAAIEAATKSAANPHFKSKYADISSVIDAIKPALVANGLFFTQRPEPAQGGVAVETVVHHASGESMALGTIFVPANKNDAQAYGSALTYARRYALVTAFGVPTEDDDGNAAARSAPSRGEGQSRESAVSPPSTDSEWGVRPKDDGPTKSEIDRTLKGIVHEIEGCGDEDMLRAFLETPEYKAAKAMLEQYRPSALFGPVPNHAPEFVPLKELVSRKIKLFRMNSDPVSPLMAG